MSTYPLSSCIFRAFLVAALAVGLGSSVWNKTRRAAGLLQCIRVGESHNP